ncbi:MAG: VanZ family protein [Oscillospiraceae bacterium]|nr:VanZ family protein [Oscillospiraceae bacterium]
MAKPKSNTVVLWRFLLVVYCTVMLWLLFGRSNGWIAGVPYKELLRQNANLIPFYTIKNYVHTLIYSNSKYMQVHCFINLGGNVLLFIPAGWLFPRVWPKLQNFFLFILLCAGLIFLVETVQLFTLLGSFDVDDMFLNLAGMTVGFILYKICAVKS